MTKDSALALAIACNNPLAWRYGGKNAAREIIMLNVRGGTDADMISAGDKLLALVSPVVSAQNVDDLPFNEDLLAYQAVVSAI